MPKFPKIFHIICLITLTIPSCLSLSLNNKNYQFQFKSHMIPHPDKAYRGGQDAYFNSSKMLVVADGVGGWDLQGIDPSQYSRFLCSASQKYLEQNPQMYTASPFKVISRAQQQNKFPSSSTMVVVTLHKNFLKYCYVGDSGFMIIRRYDKLLTIHQFIQQQHSFNFPYQLSTQQYGGDSPNLSICGDIQIKNGDIVVVGSDGFFDNVDFYQILNAVRMADTAGNVLDTLAQQLTELAIKRGADVNFYSPFAQRGKLQGFNYMGGKLDDTTVVIGQVQQIELF